MISSWRTTSETSSYARQNNGRRGQCRLSVTIAPLTSVTPLRRLLSQDVLQSTCHKRFVLKTESKGPPSLFRQLLIRQIRQSAKTAQNEFIPTLKPLVNPPICQPPKRFQEQPTDLPLVNPPNYTIAVIISC